MPLCLFSSSPFSTDEGTQEAHSTPTLPSFTVSTTPQLSLLCRSWVASLEHHTKSCPIMMGKEPSSTEQTSRKREKVARTKG
jgi:hypothetical protein